MEILGRHYVVLGSADVIMEYLDKRSANTSDRIRTPLLDLYVRSTQWLRCFEFIDGALGSGRTSTSHSSHTDNGGGATDAPSGNTSTPLYRRSTAQSSGKQHTSFYTGFSTTRHSTSSISDSECSLPSSSAFGHTLVPL